MLQPARFLGLLMLVMTLLLHTSGCLSVAQSPVPGGPSVMMKEFEFTPKEIKVKVGTTVTWINHDDDPHTVTSTANDFRSPGLDTDESYAYTFTRPGTYEYYCTLHPLMTGKVIVRSRS